MGAWKYVRATSRILNKVLFGARVASDPDTISEWSTIFVSYVMNLSLLFIVMATVFAIAGYYQPLAAPFSESALRLPVAIANVVTFALTYIASLEWRMSEDAIGRQRAANRSRGEYLVLLSLLSTAALSFLIVNFFVFNIGVLLGGASVYSALIQMLMSQRALESPYQE
jgi:hypothetical protein